MSLACFIGIVVRELKAGFGSPVQALLRLAMPGIGLLVFWMVFSGQPHQRAGMMAFLLPGFLGLVCLGGVGSVHGRLGQDASNGLLAVAVLSPTPLWVLIAGGIAAYLVQLLVQAAVLVTVGVVAFDCALDLGAAAVLRASGALLASGAFFCCLGLLLVLLIPVQAVYQLTLRIGMVVATLASTAYIPLERIPAWLRWAVGVNPLSYCCNALRAAFGSQPLDGWAPSMITLAGFAALAVAAAVATAGRVETLARH